jgi:hypothetical protein
MLTINYIYILSNKLINNGGYTHSSDIKFKKPQTMAILEWNGKMGKMDLGVTKIPKELLANIEEIIKNNPELGYTSIVEFIKEAVRTHLREVKHSEKKK